MLNRHRRAQKRSRSLCRLGQESSKINAPSARPYMSLLGMRNFLLRACGPATTQPPPIRDCLAYGSSRVLQVLKPVDGSDRPVATKNGVTLDYFLPEARMYRFAMVDGDRLGLCGNGLRFASSGIVITYWSCSRGKCSCRSGCSMTQA